jgi:two-component system sensor histidine kinase TctE
LREQDPAQQRAALLAIRAQLDETVRQTNQMLTLAKADSAQLQPEPLDAQAVAEAVTRQWWPEARERGVDLGLEPGSEALPLLGHATLLQEALSNLLHNALRYTPRGGQVTVQTRRVGEQVWWVVLDTGPGIPPDEQAKVGERFFRASNASQPGTGLGLAIVRAIAQRHGGELRVSPGPGGVGLAVAMILPMVAPSA